ncbi:MAG: hypothetical protein NZ480_09525 [Bdellovibrionaceae bacterium]|nr:hypothetical protein [Pseudobdellovibrionaceae bacterium]MDW8189861.1 glycosyltransferase family 9 protein [Pseudobdellovibrionaceae bacterium]
MSQTQPLPRKIRLAIIRIDALGDLLVTLPIQRAFDAFNKVNPQTIVIETHWVVNTGFKTLVNLGLGATTTSTEVPQGSRFKKIIFFFHLFRSWHFDAILFVYAPWWIPILSAFLAPFTVKFGRKSQWWSFLILTHSLRQKRSLAEKHEWEYNWELALFTLKNICHNTFSRADFASTINPSWPLPIRPPTRNGLLPSLGLSPKKYIVVHPGMRGSAQNLDPHQYRELIQKLLTWSYPIVITGTSHDYRWLAPIKNIHHPKLVWLIDALNLQELAYLLSQATVVIAPSTGVCHLAASCGTPVIAIYPNLVLSQSPTRWRPLGPHVTLLPIPKPSESSWLEFYSTVNTIVERHCS